jgi:hypothetical protein
VIELNKIIGQVSLPITSVSVPGCDVGSIAPSTDKPAARIAAPKSCAYDGASSWLLTTKKIPDGGGLFDMPVTRSLTAKPAWRKALRKSAAKRWESGIEAKQSMMMSRSLSRLDVIASLILCDCSADNRRDVGPWFMWMSRPAIIPPGELVMLISRRFSLAIFLSFFLCNQKHQTAPTVDAQPSPRSTKQEVLWFGQMNPAIAKLIVAVAARAFDQTSIFNRREA